MFRRLITIPVRRFATKSKDPYTYYATIHLEFTIQHKLTIKEQRTARNVLSNSIKEVFDEKIDKIDKTVQSNLQDIKYGVMLSERTVDNKINSFGSMHNYNIPNKK